MNDTVREQVTEEAGETSGNASLSEILSDISYPAEKWQITTCADLYGADVHTRRELYRLPPRVYRSVADVADTLD